MTIAIDLTTSRHRIKLIETKSERHISFSPVWSSWKETSLSRSCSTENIKMKLKTSCLFVQVYACSEDQLFERNFTLSSWVFFVVVFLHGSWELLLNVSDAGHSKPKA